MPTTRWAISCHNCKKPFTHPNITEPHDIADYLDSRAKPEFPDEGTELECPYCKSKATYHQTELWYEAVATGAL